MHTAADDLIDRRTALLALPFAPLAACTELVGPDARQDPEKHIEAVTANLGIIISGELQNASGTRFIDLDASGTEPFIHAEDGSGTTFEVLADGSATFAGSLDAATGTFSGSLSAAGGTFSGSLSAASGTFSGTVSAGAIIATDSFTATEPVFEGTVIVEGAAGAERVKLDADAGGGLIRATDDGGTEVWEVNFVGGDINMTASTQADMIGNYVLGGGTDSIAFYGGTPQGKTSVTGSRGGNAALASLLTILEDLGLITDGST